MVGINRLLNPIKTYAKNSGIQLSNDVNLLNEMRGVSALMLCSAIIILLGIFLPSLTFSSLLVASLIFLGFALGRLVSYGKDGKPGKEIMTGLVTEFILGGANIICFGLLYS